MNDPLKDLEQVIARLILETDAFCKTFWLTPEEVRRSETEYLEELWKKS